MKRILIALNMLFGTPFILLGVLKQDTILVIIGVAMLINANTICFSNGGDK